MLKYIQSIFVSGLFAIGLVLTSTAFAQPKNIQLEYEIFRGDKSFGTVKESYKQEGDQYRILSTTKGKGIYALLGERVMHSHGTVTDKGLVPAKFELKRGDSERKSLSAIFDWIKKKLTMLVKGETKTAKLPTGAQDLASYPYQFMFTPPKGNQVKLALTTGKKLKHYTYNVKARDVAIKVGGKTYKTLHLVNAEVKGKKRKELWIAPSQHYVPVQYLVVDKHGDKLQQKLTKISIQ